MRLYRLRIPVPHRLIFGRPYNLRPSAAGTSLETGLEKQTAMRKMARKFTEIDGLGVCDRSPDDGGEGRHDGTTAFRRPRLSIAAYGYYPARVCARKGTKTPPRASIGQSRHTRGVPSLYTIKISFTRSRTTRTECRPQQVHNNIIAGVAVVKEPKL